MMMLLFDDPTKLIHGCEKRKQIHSFIFHRLQNSFVRVLLVMEPITFEEIKTRLFALTEPTQQPISSSSSLPEVLEWLAQNDVPHDPEATRKDLIALYRSVAPSKGVIPSVTPIEARTELGKKITRLKTDARRRPTVNVTRLLNLAIECDLISSTSIVGMPTKAYQEGQGIKVKCGGDVIASAVVVAAHSHYLYTVKVNHPDLGSVTQVIGRDKIIK